MDAEAKLAAFLETDVPPARDAAFRLDVLERRERRRFASRLVMVIVAGAASMVGLALLATPAMQWLESNPMLALAAASAVAMASIAAAVYAGGRMLA